MLPLQETMKGEFRGHDTHSGSLRSLRGRPPFFSPRLRPTIPSSHSTKDALPSAAQAGSHFSRSHVQETFRFPEGQLRPSPCSYLLVSAILVSPYLFLRRKNLAQVLGQTLDICTYLRFNTRYASIRLSFPSHPTGLLSASAPAMHLPFPPALKPRARNPVRRWWYVLNSDNR